MPPSGTSESPRFLFTFRSPLGTLAAGLALQAIAGWDMAQLHINLGDADVFWPNLLQGFGFGLAYTPMTALAFSTLNAFYLFTLTAALAVPLVLLFRVRASR